MKLSQEKSHRAARSKYLLLALLIPSMLCVSALSFSKSYGIMDLMPAKYIYQDSTKRIAKKLVPPPPPPVEVPKDKSVPPPPPPIEPHKAKSVQGQKKLNVKNPPPAPPVERPGNKSGSKRLKSNLEKPKVEEIQIDEPTTKEIRIDPTTKEIRIEEPEASSSKGSNPLPRIQVVAPKALNIESKSKRGTPTKSEEKQTVILGDPVTQNNNKEGAVTITRAGNNKMKGLWVIDDKVYSRKQMEKLIKPNGSLTVILQNPVMATYTKDDKYARERWGQRAKRGVIAVESGK